jgi:hypothetical protein
MTKSFHEIFLTPEYENFKKNNLDDIKKYLGMAKSEGTEYCSMFDNERLLNELKTKIFKCFEGGEWDSIPKVSFLNLIEHFDYVKNKCELNRNIEDIELVPLNYLDFNKMTNVQFKEHLNELENFTKEHNTAILNMFNNMVKNIENTVTADPRLGDLNNVLKDADGDDIDNLPSLFREITEAMPKTTDRSVLYHLRKIMGTETEIKKPLNEFIDRVSKNSMIDSIKFKEYIEKKYENYMSGNAWKLNYSLQQSNNIKLYSRSGASFKDMQKEFRKYNGANKDEIINVIKQMLDTNIIGINSKTKEFIINPYKNNSVEFQKMFTEMFENIENEYKNSTIYTFKVKNISNKSNIINAYNICIKEFYNLKIKDYISDSTLNIFNIMQSTNKKLEEITVGDFEKYFETIIREKYLKLIISFITELQIKNSMTNILAEANDIINDLFNFTKLDIEKPTYKLNNYNNYRHIVSYILGKKINLIINDDNIEIELENKESNFENSSYMYFPSRRIFCLDNYFNNFVYAHELGHNLFHKNQTTYKIHNIEYIYENNINNLDKQQLQKVLEKSNGNIVTCMVDNISDIFGVYSLLNTFPNIQFKDILNIFVVLHGDDDHLSSEYRLLNMIYIIPELKKKYDDYNTTPTPMIVTPYKNKYLKYKQKYLQLKKLLS